MSFIKNLCLKSNKVRASEFDTGRSKLSVFSFKRPPENCNCRPLINKGLQTGKLEDPGLADIRNFIGYYVTLTTVKSSIARQIETGFERWEKLKYTS